MRAATTGLGFARALHTQGVLSKARYLSSTSGGSWLNSALSFNKNSSTSEFLGPYLSPEELTVDVLEGDDEGLVLGKYGKTFASALSSSRMIATFTKELIEDLFTAGWSRNQARAWTEAVASQYLDPFNLGNVFTSTTTALGTRGDVAKKLELRKGHLNLTEVYQWNPASSLPYPILTEAILRPNDVARFVPQEWTPLYAGVPSKITDGKGAKFGAGFVETFARNSNFIAKLKSTAPGEELVEVKITGPSTLALSAGISSGYIPLVMQLGKDAKEEFKSRLIGSDSLSYFDQQTFTNQAQVQMADGGGADYWAIYPLLRRGIKKIICWVATVSPISTDWTTEDDSLSVYWGTWKGKVPKGMSLEDYNSSKKVFESASWDQVLVDLRSSFEAGGAVYSRRKLKVVDNAFLGIKGGAEIELLLILNAPSSAWESSLPAATRDYIQADKDSLAEELSDKVKVLQPFLPAGVADLPLVSTQRMAYKASLVVMLSNHAAWATMQCVEEIKSMME